MALELLLPAEVSGAWTGGSHLALGRVAVRSHIARAESHVVGQPAAVSRSTTMVHAGAGLSHIPASPRWGGKDRFLPTSLSE